MSNHKALEKLIKNKVIYKIFKQAVKATYFMLGLKVLKEVVWSKKQSQEDVPQKIENFEDCIASRNVSIEFNPVRCISSNGTLFLRDSS